MSASNLTTPSFPTQAVVLSADSDQAGHIYAGGAGVVQVIPSGNSSSTPVAFTVAAGGVVPVHVRGFRTSGTTATNLVLVY